MTKRLVAGVELGGTKCICVLGGHDGALLAEEHLPTSSPAETLARIEKVLERWRVADRAAALGIASFGPLELDRNAARYGFVTRTPKPGWTGTDLAGRFKRRFGIPLAIDTDVNGAALAEGRWGAARSLSSWAYVTVGTGVGVGVIVNGAPLSGLGHVEAGHMRVARRPNDDWPGACIYHGDCVEGLASGFAIEGRTGRSAADLGADDTVWENAAHALAAMAHNLVLTCVPQRILFGGGVMMKQPHLLDRIREALVTSLAGYGAGESITAVIEQFVAAPALGTAAGPLGAIAIGARALR